MRTLSLLIATAMAAVLVLFYDSNPEVIHVDLLLGKINVALSLALVGAGLFGALTGGIIVALLKQGSPEKACDRKNKE